MINFEKYKEIKFGERTFCKICNEKSLEPIIDLPDFPLTEIYVDTKISEKIGVVDQAFQFCD